VRVILVTGKGGVGKTTVAAATAVAAADRGHRVLVSSTDPAHSLADAVGVPLGDVESEIFPLLSGQQIDTQSQLDRHWGSIRDQIMQVFDWGGVTGIEAEEFLVFPGMDELFALLEVDRQARSGDYDDRRRLCPYGRNPPAALPARGAQLVLRTGDARRTPSDEGR